MKTSKAKLTEKTESVIENITKELVKQSVLIGGIKNNNDYGFFDIKSIVIDIIDTLEDQTEELKNYAEAVEAEDD
jgi:Zn-finger domain-containing protein